MTHCIRVCWQTLKIKFAQVGKSRVPPTKRTAISYESRNNLLDQFRNLRVSAAPDDPNCDDLRQPDYFSWGSNLLARAVHFSSASLAVLQEKVSIFEFYQKAISIFDSTCYSKKEASGAGFLTKKVLGFVFIFPFLGVTQLECVSLSSAISPAHRGSWWTN